jgi:hypothetical protein
LLPCRISSAMPRLRKFDSKSNSSSSSSRSQPLMMLKCGSPRQMDLVALAQEHFHNDLVVFGPLR